jgi:hypothetical protein
VSIDGVGRLLTNYISMSKRLYPTIKVPNLDKRNIWVWDKDLLTIRKDSQEKSSQEDNTSV